MILKTLISKIKLRHLLSGLSSFVFILLLVTTSEIALAFDPMRPPVELEELIPWIFYYVLIVSGFILVIALIIAGFKYLTAVGNPTKMSDATDRIGKGIFGILLLMASFVLLHTMNPELVMEGIVVKPIGEIEPDIPRETGVHLCYLLTREHFQQEDLSFKCKKIHLPVDVSPPPEEIANRDEAHYGEVQKYRTWKCEYPQIKHQGEWRNICNNLEKTWIEMLPFDAYLYPLIAPTIQIDANSSYHTGNVHHCKDIFGKECIQITSPHNKCYAITEITIFAPKFQCYRFRTDPEIEQEEMKKFYHYRIVKEENSPYDYAIIFHENIEFEGRCFFYRSNNPKGKVHAIVHLFSRYQKVIGRPVRGNFHSLSVFEMFKRENKGTITLFEGVEFTRQFEEKVIGVNEMFKTSNIRNLRDNVRSIQLNRGGDNEPMIAILFSGAPFNRGFCEKFMDCDRNLENNRIGQRIAKDPGLAPPGFFPWLFYGSTVESIVIISGERI